MKPIENRIEWFQRFYMPVPETGCWIWLGALSRGYPVYRDRGKNKYAHIFAYATFVGKIPDGLKLDHTCHNNSGCFNGEECIHRSCVNPSHLEPVTHRVNTLRGNTLAAFNWRKTHCIRGHEFSEENTYVHSEGMKRCCRECERERYQRHKLTLTGGTTCPNF